MLSPNWDRKEPARQAGEAEARYWDDLWNEPEEVVYDFDSARLAMHQMLSMDDDWSYTMYNKPLLTSLAYYVAQDQRGYIGSKFSTSNSKNASNLDIRKGLLVYGPVGVGKTTILRVVSKLMKCKFSTAIHVAEHRESMGNLRKFESGDWFIDDVGRERESLFQKKGELKVLADLFEARYSAQRGRMIVSTNLSPDEIGDVYGMRVKDRLPEMFNVYWLGGKSWRLNK